MYTELLLFLTATSTPVIVTGKPQLSLGQWKLDPSSPIGSLFDRPINLDSFKVPTVEGSELPGLLKGLVDRIIGNEDVKVQVEENPKTSPTLDVIPADSNKKCTEKELKYEPDGKCYMKGSPVPGTDSNSPCIDDFYVFAEREDKPGYGECFCVKFRDSNTRPVVHWKQSNRCYWLYDKGPCGKEEWLVFSNITELDGSRSLICSKRTCPENILDPFNSFPAFWFEYRSQCYQTETPNSEFCGDDGKKKIYFALDKPEPVCMERRPMVGFIKGLASGAGSLDCRAGQKKLPNGQCKRTASFDLEI